MLSTEQIKQAARYRRAIYQGRTKVDLLRKASRAVKEGRTGMHCTSTSDNTIDACEELGWSTSVYGGTMYIYFKEDTADGMAPLRRLS